MGMPNGEVPPARAGKYIYQFRELTVVVDASLGTKRTCPECNARFYDLNKDPIECPKCHATFTVEPILPSKHDQLAKAEEEAAPEAVEEPVAVDPVVDVDDDEDEVAAGDVDEAAAVEDIDLGNVEVNVNPADDTFLETDDEDAPVEEIIPVVKPDDEE